MNDNIINGALKLPKMLSNEAKDLITRLLKRNPLDRIGSGPSGATEIKSHPFFRSINWTDIYNKKAKLEFKIKKTVRKQIIPIDAYIEAIGKSEDNHFNNWSFIRP